MAAPSWTEVLVLAPVGWHELVGEALALSPFASLAFGRPSLAADEPPAGFDYVRAYFSDDEDTPELRAKIQAALAGLAERAGVPELAGLEARFRRLPREDYATAWRKDFKPIRVGRLAIIPPDWTGRLRTSDVRLVLEPGGAFGTGRHPTTRGCLRGLDARMQAGERVLDAGTGSGILAVAAVLLGAGSAVGFDVDPHALGYARALAQANGVAERCEFVEGSFDAVAGARPFHGVVANLYADLIQQHAGELARAVLPRGWFVVSGCLASKREPTLDALHRSGLSVARLSTRGRWDTFEGARGNTPPTSSVCEK